METKKVTIEKIEKYWEITSKALDIIKKSINPGKEAEAKEIIEMVSSYLSDSHHFEKEGHYINAFAAVNYAHGWVDCGARLKIFNVTDSNLFTI